MINGTRNLLSLLCITAVILGCLVLYPKNGVAPLIEKMVMEKEITSISENLSGITWDPVSKKLLAVSNQPAQLFQLDLHGHVLHAIMLPDKLDTESVSFLDSNNFLIAEERKRQITIIELSIDKESYITLDSQLIFNLGGKPNSGIEGIAFSQKNNVLFIANEKHPACIYKIEGVIQRGSKALQIEKIYSSINDISGLAWSENLQRLYVLSEEDKSVVEISSNGRILRASVLSDFVKNIPQPEGIAIHNERIYIVSEPNLFYVFDMKPETH